MTQQQFEDIKAALEAAEITNFDLVTDTPTHLRNNSEAIIKQVGDYVVNFRRPQYAATNQVNGVEMVIADFGDIHEMRAYGDADSMKALAQNLGISLSDDDTTLLYRIDKSSNPMDIVTGDYVNNFKYLGEYEYNQLTPEEKEAYDEAKAAYEKAKAQHIGVNQAAEFTIS